jgi:hypothetical protein
VPLDGVPLAPLDEPMLDDAPAPAPDEEEPALDCA